MVLASLGLAPPQAPRQRVAPSELHCPLALARMLRAFPAGRKGEWSEEGVAHEELKA